MILVGELRMAADERQKISPVDHHQLTFRDRDGVRGARMSVEQRDLAEDAAFVDEVENRILAFGGRNADFHRAAADGEHALSWFAFCEYCRAALDLLHFRISAQSLDDFGGKPGEQRVVPENCFPVEDAAFGLAVLLAR